MSIGKYDNLQKTLKGCKKNKRDAQEKLYRDFYALAHSICTQYMSNQEAISELINDSFLKVFKGVIRLESSYAFMPWFKTVVRNTCIDQLRKKEIPTHAVEFTDENTPLEQGYDSSTQDLKEALLFLSGDEKRAFALFSIEGFSHQEISEKMNIPIGTSKWLLSKARKKLASIYKKN